MSDVRPEAGWLAANLELRRAKDRLTKERDAALAVLKKYIGVVEWAEGTHFLYPYEWTREEWGVLASVRPHLATYDQERSDG